MKYLLIILLSLPFALSAQEDFKPSPEIEALISQIGGKGTVYGKFVGFAGSTPGEFVAFEQFVRQASLDEMKYYLKHKDASIRAYAFWAIAVKHPLVAKTLVKELPADDAQINTMMRGCIILVQTVDTFRTQILDAPENKLFSQKSQKSRRPKSNEY